MDIIKNSLFAFISSITRNLLVGGLTWLVTRGMLDESASTQIIAIAPVVVAAVVWSFIEKYFIAKLNMAKILTALNLLPGSTLAHLDEAMRRQKTTEENTK